MSNTKKPIAERIYERFKLQWMIDHGFTLADIYSIMNEYLEEVEPEDREDISFESYLEEVGLREGSLWPCFDEFLDNECCDPEVIIPLLDENSSEKEEYALDLNAD